MNTPHARIAAAVEGKPGYSERVDIGDDGAPFLVIEHGMAAVKAGDVVELVAALGDKADATAKVLAKGAAAAGHDKIVFQRADQLQAVLALVPKTPAAPGE